MSRKPDDGKDIIVSITADKRFYIGTARLDRVEELVRKLIAENAASPRRTYS